MEEEESAPLSARLQEERIDPAERSRGRTHEHSRQSTEAVLSAGTVTTEPVRYSRRGRRSEW